MAAEMTEDKVRLEADKVLGLSSLDGKDGARSGTGQITTFNQLGFPGVADKPDGWYLPNNKNDVAVVLEVKATRIALGKAQVDEVLKNVRIMQAQYEKVIGILYNGDDVRVFKGEEEAKTPNKLQNVSYYLSLYTVDSIDKKHIYELTARINNCLHFEFGIKNLYHRMIFTACALVAERYGAGLKRLKDMDYATFHTAIHSTLSKSLENSRKQNAKIDILLEEYSDIKMNTTDNQNAINNFIDCVVEISECINSNEWRGEDVMGIFFNEFNRYKKKSEAGQVFTPEHITDFMYKILDVNKGDYILDATCGSGGFLVKAMANMIREAGGMQTDEAAEIKSSHLYGIELDREIYALACANMLIHKDGKTNLEQMDARTEAASKWMQSKPITKVLMNPPYERKYGCMTIVENVLDSVAAHTLCAFILPDKKLEKTSKTQMQRILKRHRLLKVVKLPEDLFFGVGVTTSIFVFEAGVGQDGKEFFACYMESDGLATVKNKGRHDVYGKWAAIEAHWVEVVEKQSGDETCQWVNPTEHLSYQVPQKPFEIFEENFRKTAMDYLMFKKGIDAKTFSEKLTSTAMYSSRVSVDDNTVTIAIQKGGDTDGED
ncbi:SAM-dependent methyltransferase [Bifidobacterium rousetti]|uniref:HsdM family class I SAM-dependent methyltransferase n=1 Tax=Bifidobacterium rousetti TaxID=2045439 RepID=UPI00123A61DF|nr:N-6 DNA methylase [Bifidobacterium rousetti]KAA8820493.1 SAM-dependent methyltransferase [Bifidobacterium rousetti]